MTLYEKIVAGEEKIALVGLGYDLHANILVIGSDPQLAPAPGDLVAHLGAIAGTAAGQALDDLLHQGLVAVGRGIVLLRQKTYSFE